jgi:Fe-S cluster assembly protein SufD
VNGVQLSGGDEHKEMTLLVHHEAPHCTSNQDVRHIGAGRGRAIFQGKVYVDQVAQQTEAFQMLRGILLSERAEVNTKPELEIYADDVKCSHGATTGQIDDKALFYMRARGIDEALARKMLLQSFSCEVFEDMPESIGRDQFGKMIDAWLTFQLNKDKKI